MTDGEHALIEGEAGQFLELMLLEQVNGNVLRSGSQERLKVGKPILGNEQRNYRKVTFQQAVDHFVAFSDEDAFLAVLRLPRRMVR